jgi:hypothetical protein
MPNRKYHEKYTRELLTEAVANSISIADVLRYLQIPWSGGTHAHISRRLKQLGIDTSHFKRVAPNRGKPCAWRLTPEHVLVVRPPGSPPAEAARLTPDTARERRAVHLRGVWRRGRVERQADSVARGSHQLRLAGQQEGEPPLSLSELSLADSDIRG